MTREEMFEILEQIQDAGVNAMATAGATLVGTVLTAYRRLGREHQEIILRQITTEAWRLHDLAVAKEADLSGLPLGLKPLKGSH
jgi:hypothetical protein